MFLCLHFGVFYFCGIHDIIFIRNIKKKKMLKKKKIPNKKREHACIMWDQIRSLYIMHQRIKGKDNWFPHTYLIQYILSCTKPKPLIPNQTVTKPDLILKIKHLHTHEWNSYRSSASLSQKKKKPHTAHTLFLTKHSMNTRPASFLSLFCCLFCQKISAFLFVSSLFIFLPWNPPPPFSGGAS